MFRSLVVLSTLLLLSPVFPQSQSAPPATPAPAAIPPEALKVVNPVKVTPESHAKAKKTYGYDCMMCHGKMGKGDGDLAVDMKLKLADFTDPASLKNITDGELFYVLKNGRGQMPAERGKNEDLWSLVSYVRSLSAGGPAAPEAAPGPATVQQP